MKLRDIGMVARYEALMVSRGFVFRFLAVLVLVGITFLQIKEQSDFYFCDWHMIAMSSCMPFVNAYLFNIVQMLFVVFVVMDLPRREERWGVVECIHCRPVDNDDYFIGKTIGGMMVFLCLGGLSAVLGLFINLVASESPCNPLLYLYYFSTCTLPSLVFCMGFFTFLSFVIRNRGLMMFAGVALWYASLTVLPGFCHGALDFSGSALPNLFSGVTGHPGLGGYLLHRLSFLAGGTGFMFLGVLLMKRLSGKPGDVKVPGRVGVALLCLGVLVGGVRLGAFWRTDAVREAYRRSYDRYREDATCRVSNHAITMRQEGKLLTMESEMVLHNAGKDACSRVVVFLNPGLRVTSVEENGKGLSFSRDNQVLSVERHVGAGDSVKLRLEYHGTIDERYAYLYVPDALYHDTRREHSLFCFGSRYAIVSDRFLWLLPECGWYPEAVVREPRGEKLVKMDYTSFRLNVMAPRQRVVLSQGERSFARDTLKFYTPRALEGISLCGGDYRRRTVQLSGFKVDLYNFREEDVVPKFFSRLGKRAVARELERYLKGNFGGSKYDANSVLQRLNRFDWCYSPESRLILAEIPLSATSFRHQAEGKSGLVQPGMLFLPERGTKEMKLPAPAAHKRYFLKKGASSSYNSEKELEEEMFRSIVYGFGQERRWNPFINGRVFRVPTRVREESLLGDYNDLLVKPAIYIHSDRFPVFDQIYHTWIRGFRSAYREVGRSMDERDMLVWNYIQTHNLEMAVRDKNINDWLWQQILSIKAEELFNLMVRNASGERVEEVIDNFWRQHTGVVPLERFLSEIQDSLGVNLGENLKQWYFSVRPNVIYQVKDEKVLIYSDDVIDKCIGEFKIRNLGDVAGVVTVMCNRNGYGVDYFNVLLNSGECKLVRLPMTWGRAMYVSMGMSRNLPRYIEISAAQSNGWGLYKYGVTKDSCCGVFSIGVSDFEADGGEIIVDDESPDFSVTDLPKKWLKRLFVNSGKPVSRSMSWRDMNPDEWFRAIGNSYYGDTLRGVHYKTGGDGRCKAEWKTQLKEAGKYEIFALAHYMYRDQKTPIPYYYTIGNGGEAEEVVVTIDSHHRGWVSLGKFDLPAGETKVILSDRGEPESFIIADAVKWVKVE